ncbi:helix-turn-helix domain-containing protein [Butyricicoccus sp. 1XD8-22]|nr:helix-turn-helix domain-containing protein [Butyricicoccus sp. 1XD8-22]
MEKKQLAEIGQRLRQKRNELGLTREKFAELADIGAGYYGQLEVGTSQMSIDTLIKVSRAMHLPMEYILFGEGYEPGSTAAVQELLSRCTERELRLAEEMLKLFLMKQ